MRAGKMLLQWAKRGEGNAGEVEQDYQVLLRQVKQGVNEAVLRERVPPGYRAMIQRYFDRLERSPAPNAGESGKSGK